MDLIKQTRELGAAIQADERYVKMNAAKKANDEDAALQGLIGEMNMIVLRYNKEAEKSEEAKDEAKLKELHDEYQQTYANIMENENMKAYQAAQQEVEELANYINQILAMSLNGQDPMTCEPQASCGSDCGTCGGCG